MTPALLVLGALALSGCAQKGTPISAREADDGAVAVDTDVMAYLSLARALHHEANLKEDSGDLPGAIAPLERLVRAQTPHAGAHIPEVEEVLADTYARMAELRMRTQDLDKANADIQAGLGHAPGPTYFRGHLLEVAGVVEETRATSLADAGRAEEAAKTRAHAFDLLNQAVSVQEEVVSKSLGEDAGTAEGGHK